MYHSVCLRGLGDHTLRMPAIIEQVIVCCSKDVWEMLNN